MAKHKHVIKVFTVFDPNGSASLAYIRQGEDHPSDVGPGQPVTFVPGEKVRWRCMSKVPMTIEFDDGSPFVSGDTNLAASAPNFITARETIKQDVPTAGGGNPDYKYTVTVQGVPPDDPDVIIDLSGGGGGGGKKSSSKPKPKPKTKTKTKTKLKTKTKKK